MEVIINGIKYTYLSKTISIGDNIVIDVDTLPRIYKATIHDADEIGNVVIREEEYYPY